MTRSPVVVLTFDLEGITGVDEIGMGATTHSRYVEARRRLTDDVNAAVRGLEKGGAGMVWIQDGHGSGNQESDVLETELEPLAKIDYRAHSYIPYTSGITPGFDALVLVGAHPGPTGGGFAGHVDSTDVASYRINGAEVTEAHLYALSAARFGIPLIFVSGDDVLKNQLDQDFPGLEYAEVKKSESPAAARSYDDGACRTNIEECAHRAMRAFIAGASRPLYWRPPFVFRIQWRNYEQAEGARRHPLVFRDGETGITYTTEDCAKGIEISLQAMGLAWDGPMVMRRLLMERPEGRRLIDEWRSAMIARVFSPAAAPAFSNPPAQRVGRTGPYFGMR